MYKKSIILSQNFLYIYKSKIKREAKEMARLVLFSNTINETYKTTAEAMNEIDLNKKLVVRKSLVDMMKLSFFHGASRFGNNFIA